MFKKVAKTATGEKCENINLTLLNISQIFCNMYLFNFFVQNILGIDMLQELVSLEPNIIEQHWIEQTTEKVLKPRVKQEDVDAISFLFCLGVNGDSVAFDRAQHLFMYCLKVSITKLMEDFDQGLRKNLDRGSSAVAMLWLFAKGSNSANFAEDMKAHFNLAPSQAHYTIMPVYDHSVDYDKEVTQKLTVIWEELRPFVLDTNIHSLVLLSLLTSHEDYQALNQMLNKMLLKKIHEKYPNLEADEMIRFIKIKLIEWTKLLPYVFEFPEDD